MKSYTAGPYGLLTVLVALGQSAPVSAMACYDSAPLGDGWGWNGQTGCRIPADPCTDDDGDGIGVNSLGECKIIVDGCIDDDGDSYGWNGIATCRVYPLNCVDTDGDGYGWNGFRTCLVPTTETTTETTTGSDVQQPTAPTTPDPVTNNDPLWPVCTTAVEIGAWSEHTGSAGSLESCVRTCGTGAADDALYPGWGSDTRGRCLISSAVTGEQAAVPLYAPDRLELPSLLDATKLSENNNSWQCSFELRVTLSDDFTAIGSAGDYLFMADGQLIVEHADGSVESDGTWFTNEQMITLALTDQQQFNAVDFPMGSQDNVAHLYSTDLDRLSCVRQSIQTTPVLPEPEPQQPEPEPQQPEPEEPQQPESEPEPQQPEPEPEPQQPEPEPEPQQPEPEPEPQQPEPEPEPQQPEPEPEPQQPEPEPEPQQPEPEPGTSAA